MSVRILASIPVDTGLTGDQPVDMSAYVKYVISDVIFADLAGLAGKVNVGLYPAPNKTGIPIFQHQPAQPPSIGGRFGLPTSDILIASTLYVNVNFPHAGSLTLHLIGDDVP